MPLAALIPLLHQAPSHSAFWYGSSPYLIYTMFFTFIQIFVRKLTKAVAKKEGGAARRLRRSRPRIDLAHIVKERFFSFETFNLILFCPLFEYCAFRIGPLHGTGTRKGPCMYLRLM